MNKRIVIGVAAVIVIGLAVVGWKRCGGSGERVASVAIGGSGAGAGRTGSTGSSLRGRALPPDPRTLSRASITGTVHSVDAAGKAATPLADALVCVSRNDNDVSGQTTFEPTCTTSGADGTYSLLQLIPGTWLISASAPAHLPARWKGPPPDEDRSFQLAAAEARQGMNLTLSRGGVEVRGVVSDINGGPVSGAFVEVRGNDWRSAAYATRSTTDGTFTAWARAGEISVSATAEGYADGSVQGVAPTAMLEVLLTPESIIAGVVIDRESQAPVEGAHVSTSSDWTDGGSSGNDITDAQGRFRIARLTPGRYKPSAYAPGGYGTAGASVMLGLGETVENVRIELHKTAVATGRIVIDDGTGTLRPCPPNRCHIWLRNRAASHDESASTRADGKVIFETMLPGTYNVMVGSRDYLAEQDYPDVVIADADVAGLEWKVSSGAGEMVGRVRTQAGDPVPDAEVSAHTVGGGPRGQQSRASDTTKSDGFRLRGLTAGTFEIDAEADAYLSPDPTPRVPVALDAVANVDIILAAGGALSGLSNHAQTGHHRRRSARREDRRGRSPDS